MFIYMSFTELNKCLLIKEKKAMWHYTHIPIEYYLAIKKNEVNGTEDPHVERDKPSSEGQISQVLTHL
jgi:hypothetical protein